MSKGSLIAAKELVERNPESHGWFSDEALVEALSNIFTEEQLRDVSEPHLCHHCGKDVQVKEWGGLWGTECPHCGMSGEMFWCREFAVLSHNTETWFDDGLIAVDDDDEIEE
jgi:predicted RNA-binding Zn-ribbon protein involved in translation (DUF1610 family)